MNQINLEVVRLVEHKIYLIRGQKVMLDSDLAELYGVVTYRLNEQVRRNKERFPMDFMFQLTGDEVAVLKSQIVTSKDDPNLRSQIAISSLKENYGGRRYLPYVFTEQGVAMLSSVLRSERAIQVNIAIMRAFVKLRQILASHKDLAEKLDALEAKYDKNFKVVFDAIKALMLAKVEEESTPKKPMGFVG